MTCRDNETYGANAGNPSLDAWCRRWRACLDEDAIWEDGDIVVVITWQTSPE